MIKLKNKLPEAPNGVKYETLKDGDTFLFEGTLYVKTDLSIENQNQCSFCLSEISTHIDIDDMCGIKVTPVDVELTWKERKLKGKKTK